MSPSPPRSTRFSARLCGGEQVHGAVGTAERVAELLGRPDTTVVSNPEFLREGRAVHDFLHPDRIVVGADDPDAAQRVAALYAALDSPVVLTDTASAELTEYAANFFLAMKLSFANNLATFASASMPTSKQSRRHRP